jgi:hypothetical protein
MLVVNVLIGCRSILNTSTTEWCFRAIGALARKSEANKQILANHGACEIIMQASQLASTSAVDIKHPAVVEAVCWAIANLAYPDDGNQDRLRYSMYQ